MSLLELSRVNLKLLVCLQALLEEQSVSRTAQHLCLSQSAVSKSLSQLRELLDDPLFTRTPHGLVPTIRAMQLKEELTPIMQGLWQVIQPKQFIPSACERNFHIAFPETAFLLLFQHTMSAINLEAPQVKIGVRNLSKNNIADLVSGKLDMVLLPGDTDFGQEKIAGMYSKILYTDTLVCQVRKHHPCLEQEWCIDRWLELKHIGIGKINSHWLEIDKALSIKNLSRNVAVSVEDFYSATGMCENTDLAISPPSLWADYALKHFDVVSLPIPFTLKPICYVLYWHERNHDDPAHRWLRSIIEAAARNLH
ncbi:LysR family transcriptional regulator [Sansalvadorimonas verongulae]|uniref:LysR family transcriptional regulator n=1 Tax=Sansalvadorimonas verongulae TaxID=2172824 RepID=UPI0012BBADD4|nr:LysR family transcriptional regulator [Sansalvadorimonas verongulae]MTI14202.1 LysR family transcriptional regulator [Sansalvadorimonas verongulae]